MKKQFIIGAGCLLYALTCAAQTSTVQATAATVQSPISNPAPLPNQGIETKSVVAASIGESSTTANSTATTGSTQMTQAVLPEAKNSRSKVENEKE